MAAVLKVQVETERPGIVMVRAVAPESRRNDAKPVAGFFVRRRFHGDTFKIAKWEEFSPRWMEFVDDPPAEWQAKIKAREHATDDFVARVKAEDAKTPQQRTVETLFSMLQMQAEQQAQQSINLATGVVTPLDKGDRKGK